MRVSIADIPENKSFSDYPENTEFVLEEDLPRYILDPFEIILPGDSRYKNALTRKEINSIAGKTP